MLFIIVLVAAYLLGAPWWAAVGLALVVLMMEDGGTR